MTHCELCLRRAFMIYTPAHRAWAAPLCEVCAEKLQWLGLQPVYALEGTMQ